MLITMLVSIQLQPRQPYLFSANEVSLQQLKQMLKQAIVTNARATITNYQGSFTIAAKTSHSVCHS